MRSSIKVIAVAGVLLAIPLVGHVQQVPQAPGQTPQQVPSFRELAKLVSAQTEVIKSLNERVKDLETRIKALEAKSPDAPQ